MTERQREQIKNINPHAKCIKYLLLKQLPLINHFKTKVNPKDDKVRKSLGVIEATCQHSCACASVMMGKLFIMTRDVPINSRTDQWLFGTWPELQSRTRFEYYNLS